MLFNKIFKNAYNVGKLSRNYGVAGFSQLKVQVENIRNNNLRFQGDAYYVNMFTFYPQLFKKKEKNSYEVYAHSNVLSLVFLNKSLDFGEAWQERKSISLRFKQMGKILSAQIGSGRQVIIETALQKQTNERRKILKIKDLKQSQQIQFSLQTTSQYMQSGSDLQAQQKKQQTKNNYIVNFMNYEQYIIMYKLIENSLLDLSGLRLMIETQKKQQINKLENKLYAKEKQLQELLNH